MKVFRHFPKFPTEPVALAIGNFDGIHLGHRYLLSKLIEIAETSRIGKAVLTFEPHPREYFNPQNAPARLTSLREKLEWFEYANVDKVYICKFNKEFSQLSSQSFIDKVLIGSLNAQKIVVGDDFRFGKGREGEVGDFIRAGFQTVCLPDLIQNGSRVSSTLIREALALGNLDTATHLLGRAYSISGKVIHGAKLGRKLGFPTANVHMRHERPALLGVYAVKLDGIRGVANLGVRPTVTGVSKLQLEVHLIDFDGDLYGKHVHVEFYSKIRNEMKFSGLEALKVQISRDVEIAKRFFENSDIRSSK